MLSLVLFIVILGTIVLIHELGHFLFAKLFGVYVYVPFLKFYGIAGGFFFYKLQKFFRRRGNKVGFS